MKQQHKVNKKEINALGMTRKGECRRKAGEAFAQFRSWCEIRAARSGQFFNLQQGNTVAVFYSL